jgi:hypothetical protein
MPRPTDETLAPTAGFGPSASPNTNLGVYAPLDVNAAPSQASALANALGVAADHINPILRRKAREEGAANAEHGMADAMTGNIDPELQKADSAYREGAYKVTIEKQIQGLTQQALEDFRANPQADRPTSEVLKEIDAKIGAQLAPLDKDPIAASIMVRYHKQLLEQVAGEHLTLKAHANANTALDAVGARITNDLNTSGTTDYDAAVKSLAPLLPGGLTDANDAVTNMLIQEAKRRGDETLLDKLIPKSVTNEQGQQLPGPGTVPRRAAAIAAANEQIKADNERKNADAKTMQSYSTMAHWNDQQAQNQKVPEADIQQALKDKLISEGAALAIHGRNAEIDRNASEAQLWQNFFASGNHWSTTGLDPDEVRKHLDTVVAAQPPERRLPLAAALTASQGLMPSPLKDYLSTPAQQSAQGLQQQLQVYAQLRQNAPAAVINNVPEHARAMYDRALELSKTGMQPDAILKELQTFDPEAAKKAVEAARPQIDAAVKAGVTMNRGPGTAWFGMGSATVSPNDYTNGPQVQQQIKEQAEVLVQHGFSPADAAKRAAQNVYDSSVTVKTPQGLLMLPRTDGMPADADKAVDYLYSKIVPEVVKQDGHGLDAKDVRLAVQPGTQGRSTLVLVGPNGETLGSPFTLQGLYGLYQKGTQRDRWQAGQDARGKSEAIHRTYQDQLAQHDDEFLMKAK